MSAPPPISVLLPVRDGGSVLAEAIESLEAQTLADFEVIAVDDGSTDYSSNLLQEWAIRDARVNVLTQEPMGIIAALERARLVARGAYLARMDADDISEPERFARQWDLMESDERLVLCGCGVEYFPLESVRDGARRYQAWLNASNTHDEIAREIFVECPLAHPSFFMRAEAVSDVGGYQDHGWAEDYDLVLRLWRSGGSLGKVPEALLRWREGDQRLSRTNERYSSEAFRRCKVHHLRETFLGARQGVVIWGAGPVGKAFGRALGKEGVQISAFAEVDPRKIGQNIHGAPVLNTASALGLRGVFHIAAVGQPGARETLRSLLSGADLHELQDFACVA